MVNSAHIAACHHPYHFSEWLCDGSGNKVHIIVDLAGRLEDTPTIRGRVDVFIYDLPVVLNKHKSG